MVGPPRHQCQVRPWGCKALGVYPPGQNLKDLLVVFHRFAVSEFVGDDFVLEVWRARGRLHAEHAEKDVNEH